MKNTKQGLQVSAIQHLSLVQNFRINSSLLILIMMFPSVQMLLQVETHNSKHDHQHGHTALPCLHIFPTNILLQCCRKEAALPTTACWCNYRMTQMTTKKHKHQHQRLSVGAGVGIENRHPLNHLPNL